MLQSAYFHTGALTLVHGMIGLIDVLKELEAEKTARRPDAHAAAGMRSTSRPATGSGSATSSTTSPTRGSRRRPRAPARGHGELKRLYAWVPRLARDFRVVRLDLRGHGGSQVPDDALPFTLDRLARDVVELLDHLGSTACTWPAPRPAPSSR